jgi:tetratricopeptide (TPR) repeat protein
MIAESMTALERVIQLTPDNHVALKILGHLYRDAGRNEDALVVLHRVLDLNPQDSECKAVIDMLIQAMGSSGEKSSDMASEGAAEEDDSVLDDWSACPGLQDDADGPERLIGTAELGDDPLATPTLAEMYVKQGFAGQALDIYRQLLHGDPGNSTYRMRIDQIAGSLEPSGFGAGEAPPVSGPDGGASTGESVEKVLEELLDKIERRRTCHSGKY